MRRSFSRFLRRQKKLGVPLFIHPNNPGGIERTADYYLTNFLGILLESTIAAAKLVFGGVLDRYPNLKICLSHAGGVLPFLLGRLEHGRSIRRRQADIAGSRSRISEEPLRRHHHIPCRYPPFRLGPYASGTCVHGTDYPYDMAETDPVGL